MYRVFKMVPVGVFNNLACGSRGEHRTGTRICTEIFCLPIIQNTNNMPILLQDDIAVFLQFFYPFLQRNILCFRLGFQNDCRNPFILREIPTIRLVDNVLKSQLIKGCNLTGSLFLFQGFLNEPFVANG